MGITTAEMPCEIAGTSYMLHPLSLKEIEELDHWMQARFLRSVLAASKDEVVIKIAMQEMCKLSFFSREGAKQLATVEGVAKLFSLSASLSYEEARDVINPRNDVVPFNIVFAKLNGLGRESEGETKSSDPIKAE